ncbi:MAG TPA: antibiotic biosynthesis monooxygenase family protein [Ktedonobacterales bacterium]|nr:antibiotic biosynthesis monooxygenase family protein [Ktedonobacterales bacterium]
MFIAVTRVKLPKEPLERMAQAFRNNAADMKQFAGFLGLELWTNEDTLEAVSRWESREAMEAYSRSSAFQAHHGHGPGGAQGPGSGAPTAGGVEYFTGEVLV